MSSIRKKFGLSVWEVETQANKHTLERNEGMERR